MRLAIWPLWKRASLKSRSASSSTPSATISPSHPLIFYGILDPLLSGGETFCKTGIIWSRRSWKTPSHLPQSPARGDFNLHPLPRMMNGVLWSLRPFDLDSDETLCVGCRAKNAGFVLPALNAHSPRRRATLWQVEIATPEVGLRPPRSLYAARF